MLIASTSVDERAFFVRSYMKSRHESKTSKFFFNTDDICRKYTSFLFKFRFLISSATGS